MLLSGALFVVVQQREDLRAVKPLSSFEKVQLHHKAQAHDLRAQRFSQLHAGIRGAAGGQKVVHDHHALAWFDGIFVDLQSVGAVLELVAPFDRLRRELAGLADRHKAGVQTISQRRTKNETTRFNRQHGIHFGVEVVFGKRVDQRGKPDFVSEQGRNVVKKNSLFWEVWNFADQFLQVLTITAAQDLFLHVYHAPSMRNVVKPLTGSAGLSCTSSTRAARGPFISFFRSASSCGSMPMARTSTVPSRLLRTQPDNPS